MPYAGFYLVIIDDSAPEEVADVGRQRVDPSFLSIEREREILAVWEPEISIESTLELGGLALQPRRQLGILPNLARQARAAHFRVIHVALNLAGRPRKWRELSIGKEDRVPRVLPALV